MTMTPLLIPAITAILYGLAGSCGAFSRANGGSGKIVGVDDFTFSVALLFAGAALAGAGLWR